MVSCCVEREVITVTEVKKLSEKQIQNRLQKYFDANYSEYADTAQYHTDPQNNMWLYDIEELGKSITLTCDEQTGKVTETQADLIQEQKEEIDLENYEVINPMKMGM